MRTYTGQLEGANETTCRASPFAYLAAGLGIGAAVSIFFAPKPGEETRKWIANKCLNAVDTANERVRETRTHAMEFMDRGQELVSAAVAARRDAIGKTKEVEPGVDVTVA